MKEESDRNIHIAFLQLLPGKTLEEQLEIGQKACREAKKKGADIALFPEMWSDGYFLPQDEKVLKSLSISKDSAFVQSFRHKQYVFSRNYVSILV